MIESLVTLIKKCSPEKEKKESKQWQISNKHLSSSLNQPIHIHRWQTAINKSMAGQVHWWLFYNVFLQAQTSNAGLEQWEFWLGFLFPPVLVKFTTPTANESSSVMKSPIRVRIWFVSLPRREKLFKHWATKFLVKTPPSIWFHKFYNISRIEIPGLGYI